MMKLVNELKSSEQGMKKLLENAKIIFLSIKITQYNNSISLTFSLKAKSKLNNSFILKQK